jgi:hypothetical protein
MDPNMSQFIPLHNLKNWVCKIDCNIIQEAASLF